LTGWVRAKKDFAYGGAMERGVHAASTFAKTELSKFSRVSLQSGIEAA
jgi:hypothetical protein